MTTPPALDQLRAGLRAAVRHGAAAARLAARSPALVDLVAPGPEPVEQRALAAEHLISHAVQALDPPTDQAMRIMLGLDPATRRASVDHRRHHAAQAVGVQPDTFRRPNWEGALLLELTFEVYRRTNPAS